MHTGIREQLAAALVERDNATLAIHGAPGDWSIAVAFPDSDAIWLASVRRPSQLRTFKTLDAAHAAAIDVARAADPEADITHVTVPVTMSSAL